MYFCICIWFLRLINLPLIFFFTLTLFDSDDFEKDLHKIIQTKDEKEASMLLTQSEDSKEKLHALLESRNSSLFSDSYDKTIKFNNKPSFTINSFLFTGKCFLNMYR